MRKFKEWEIKRKSKTLEIKGLIKKKMKEAGCWYWSLEKEKESTKNLNKEIFRKES